MHFAFSEEQEFLRQTAQEWMAKESPLSAVRTVMETEAGFDEAHWAELAGLGWHAMAIPEEYGGAGYGFLELAVLLEEMGAGLLPAPFLSTVALGANAVLLAASEEQKSDMLPGVAMGETRLAVAIGEDEGPWAADRVATTATSTGDGWALTGTKRFVIDGHTANHLIVAASTGSEVGLFGVVAGAEGMGVELLPTMDSTRKLADVTLDSTPAVRLGEGDASDHIETLLRIASVAVALESVGGAQRTLDMAVSYAKDRVQFGRPIGSFQAIKHKCADMLLAVNGARATAYYAAWALSEGSDELERVAPLAKASCTEAYFHCAQENIQIHGGIGFTWEHDAHLYFKRAKSNELLIGAPSQHRALLADRLGL
ncbi:MAG: acyl-CoA/acyl-ACP dehydrogenase [Acidimicrobiia bacterium]|nr:acyl-CoA/acyl-ACP dehydrogenase [Acidimicrobiia bacterium]